MAGSIIPRVAGSLASGLIGGLGSSKAEKQLRQGADASQQIVNPSPFRANSLFGGVGAGGQFSLNSLGQKQLNNFNRLSDRSFNRAISFNRGSFRDRLLEASNRVNDKREGQAFASLESKLFNRAGASTGTQRQIADFGADLEDRRFNRALQAEIGADQFNRGLIGDFQNSLTPLNNLNNNFLNFQNQSLAGAQALRPYAIDNPAMALASSFQAQNTQDFFNNLGGFVGGGIQTGINYFGNRPTGNGTGNPFNGTGPQLRFGNKSAINFGSNPFTSIGFG